ncbi:MAG: hypothetical protein ACLURV_06650 [Gallintestinimicrobium sp.]
MGIAILPPDINEGEPGFSVSGKSIRYGLTAIKGVGHPVADAVIAERKQRACSKPAGFSIQNVRYGSQ